MVSYENAEMLLLHSRKRTLPLLLRGLMWCNRCGSWSLSVATLPLRLANNQTTCDTALDLQVVVRGCRVCAD